MYILKKRGTKKTFCGALYLTNNKFCTMRRPRREEVKCCLCITEHKRACTVQDKKKNLKASGDQP